MDCRGAPHQQFVGVCDQLPLLNQCLLWGRQLVTMDGMELQDEL